MKNFKYIKNDNILKLYWKYKVVEIIIFFCYDHFILQNEFFHFH